MNIYLFAIIIYLLKLKIEGKISLCRNLIYFLVKENILYVSCNGFI